MKKGFTLIELLAVIVILAIIALIATPIVLNIINDTKESAVLRSADFYIDALENEIMLENMKQGGNFNPNICTITNKEITCDGKEINLKVNGELPTSGSITFEEGKVKDVNLTYQNGNVTLNNKGELVLGEVEIVLAPGLYDENDNLLASWTELVEKHDFKTIIEADAAANVEFVIAENYPEATKLVIDESVTSIGDYAFERCTNLKEITIPDSVTSIGNYAFRECTSITNIIIPNSVTIIEESAFMDCTSLTSATIGSGVTSIGSHAFSGCTSLTSITVDDNNKIYDSRDNSNAIIETSTNALIAGCKNTIIPNSVTSIGNYAFQGCTSLNSIKIPNSVTSIGGAVFSGCTSLKEIIIPNSVTSITDSAFEGCTNLKEITIPNSVTSIGFWAFQECTSLKEITIPNSLTSIGSHAFSGCTSLTTIYYKGDTSGKPWGAPSTVKVETNF